MKKRKIFSRKTAGWTGAVVLFLGLLFVFQKQLTDPFVENSVESGEVIYEQNCLSCHGEDGTGRRLGTATTLHNQQFLTLASDSFLYETIADGRDGTAMPAFAGELTVEEIKDVVAYIRSWQEEVVKMPTPEAINGDPEAGRLLYEKNCLSCHADGIGPAVINQDFLESVSDEFLWDTTAYGRIHTAMGPSLTGLGGIRELEPGEISSIVAYLRSLENEK